MLTRAEQFEILYPVVLAYQTVCMQLGEFPPSATGHGVSSFRAALRLDDPYLDGIIAGAKCAGRKLEWTSEVAR